jgi:CheY-like chemotaxis protein
MSRQSVFLLVEDNEDDVFFMKRAFKDARLPNQLRVVNSGDDAIAYLSNTGPYSDREQNPQPDMVFLDLKMPGLDGFEVLSWIRQDRRLTVPVAVLTSSPEDSDRMRARILGADCYLLKPPTRAMLRSCCDQFKLECGTNQS